MTMITAAEALSAAESAATPGTAPRHLFAVNGSQPQTAVNLRCTPNVTWLPCAGECGAEYHGGKRDGSGKCRACYLKGLGENNRKTEPETQFAMLARMARSAARRAEGEDPGRGLKLLMDHQALIRDLVNEVGPAITAQYGPTVVAAELGTTKQNVWKRWGGEDA